MLDDGPKTPDKSIKYFSPGSFLATAFSSCACILNYTSYKCAGEDLKLLFSKCAYISNTNFKTFSLNHEDG